MDNKIRIANIQRGCVYDGKGIRTTVFLKGCSLQCPWCCNPETINIDTDYYIDESKCFVNRGIESDLCSQCERKGGRFTIEHCRFGVCTPTSTDNDLEEVYNELSRDFDLMKESEGGVTFSGGEPLLQIRRYEKLCKQLKKDDIQIAFETTFVVSEDLFLIALDCADCFILDLKLQPSHKLYKDQKYIEMLSKRLDSCRKRAVPLQYRLVFVDNMADDLDYIVQVLYRLSIGKIELLKCHNLGKPKYERLGMKNIDCTATDYLFNQFACDLNNYKIEVTKIET